MFSHRTVVAITVIAQNSLTTFSYGAGSFLRIYFFRSILVIMIMRYARKVRLAFIVSNSLAMKNKSLRRIAAARFGKCCTFLVVWQERRGVHEVLA